MRTYSPFDIFPAINSYTALIHIFQLGLLFLCNIVSQLESLSLSLSLSNCQSVSRASQPISIITQYFLSCLWCGIYLSIHPTLFTSIHPSQPVNDHLSISLSQAVDIHRSIHLSLFKDIYLSNSVRSWIFIYQSISVRSQIAISLCSEISIDLSISYLCILVCSSINLSIDLSISD